MRQPSHFSPSFPIPRFFPPKRPVVNTKLNENTFTASPVQPKKENNSSSINIFGMNLEIDDILILGILFFLYTEGVKDQSLYIILIMLLLS